MSTSRLHYSTLSITLHWLMLGLFIGVYACIQLKGIFPRGSTGRELALGLHGLFGLSILGLVWLRLVGRLLKRAPPIDPPLLAWQKHLARLVHLLLYGLMIATPALGWLMLAVGGKPIPYFELHPASPMALDAGLAKQLKSWHELLGNAGYYLIGFHALAGLVHHYWIKDNTLTRMFMHRDR